MALVHYTDMGVQYAPCCADRDGFVTYNKAHCRRLVSAAKAGADLDEAADRIGATEGTLWVAATTIHIDESRAGN